MSSWPKVLPKDDGIRPAGAPDECFYCNQKVGSEHERNCVTITKLLKFKAVISGLGSFEYEEDIPHSWPDEHTLFARNESGWCASNIVNYLKDDEVKKVELYMQLNNTCLCGECKIEVLGVVNPGPLQKPEGD